MSDARVRRSRPAPEFESIFAPARVISSEALGTALQSLFEAHSNQGSATVDAAAWNAARFKPIPPIIEAAVTLYAGNKVFEIGHACAPREALESATNAIIEIVKEAKATSSKAICFVTGVPGAGKTLVGLNAVHESVLKEDAAFLSGNGPLVNVLQEALIRDQVRRGRATNRDVATTYVRSKIRNVHRFAADYYLEGGRTPTERTVIFDEAQRAWDAQQNRRAKRPACSEAHMMLDVMSRHTGAAVIVALIGGGQEINRGEAGLEEWGSALSDFPGWKVYASPELLKEDAPRPFRLFRETAERRASVATRESLHLRVPTRSVRARSLSDWVDYLLEGESAKAASVARSMGEVPILTRELQTCRTWLREQLRGKTRAGLVASASASRLRVDGLETAFGFHHNFEWEHWFLDHYVCDDQACDHQYCNDVRASSSLEVAATQFEIQGLELDWVGVCWGDDLTWNGTGWDTKRFNNRLWRPIPSRQEPKKRYLLNGYRVLLTRARQGMILYVPRPSQQDRFRLATELDGTAKFLLACGARELNS